MEAETKQLRDREEIIRAIRDEQRQVRPYVAVALACAVRPSRDPPPPAPRRRPLRRRFSPNSSLAGWRLSALVVVAVAIRHHAGAGLLDFILYPHS